MDILLDTHILLWHLQGEKQLRMEYSELIESPENQIFISIVSLWEIALKVNIGKLNIHCPIEQLLPKEIIILGINVEHISALQTLPFHHKDPFDRMIIAQAICENLKVISDDSFFKNYSITLL